MRKVLLITIGGLMLLALLGGCAGQGVSSTLSDADALLTAQASGPLPTQMAGLGLTAAKSSACLVREDAAVGTSDPQGDMLAWSPEADTLAYVRPVNGRWAWFVGDLVLYDVRQDKELFTTYEEEVFGDLAWSGDAANMAFVVLDPSTGIYTIQVLDVAGGSETDIFASTSAKTDDWASTKGVTEWADNSNLTVTSSCGSDCARIYNYNLETGSLTIQGDERKNEDSSLELTNEMASPDGNWTTAADTLDNFWLANTKTNKAFILLAGSVPLEVKWSYDSRYLALRTEDRVYIYQVNC